MDKQIIDGIDVSKCECLIEDYQRANNLEGRYEHIKNVCELGERGVEYYNIFCKDNSNCYYKQLKRKEGIIKRLKEKHNRMCKSCPKTISCDECSNNTTLKILNGEIV